MSKKKKKLFVPVVVIKSDTTVKVEHIAKDEIPPNHEPIVQVDLQASIEPTEKKDFPVADEDDFRIQKKGEQATEVKTSNTTIAIDEPDSTPPKSFSHVSHDSAKDQKWFIVGASAIGKSHVKGNLPCQDNHYCEEIGNGWGIAISCDGAGSAAHSELGAAHVANEIGPAFFKKLISKNNWHTSNIIPTEDQWTLAAREGFEQIYHSLKRLAMSRDIETSSLACTTIVVIYSPVCLLVAHIGDGRAGFCNEKKEWRSIITPHKGEEANQTIFITSNRWITDASLKMSGVSIPECRIIREKPKAFTLMSDGCESHSFECSRIDKETNRWSDPNLPYPKFFDPLVHNLKGMSEAKVSNTEANDKWRKFIEGGSAGLKAEIDDKTMILGVSI